jgi:hypothetical protein
VRFNFKGQKFETAEDMNDWTFGEIEHCEKLLKKKVDDWSAADQTRAAIFVALRRSDHTLLRWDDMTAMSPNDFHPEPDADGEAGQVPPEGGEQVSPPSTRTGGRRSPKSSASARGRSATD